MLKFQYLLNFYNLIIVKIITELIESQEICEKNKI